jgi:hypothetical protein
MKKTLTSIAAGAALLAGSVAAIAAPITGQINLGFAFSATDGNGNAVTSLQNADVVTPLGNVATVNFVEDGSVLDGYFTDLLDAPASIVSHAAINVGSFSPIAILWSGNGISFSLETLSVDQQTADDLDLSGTGYLSAQGYEDTLYTWSFSGNNDSNSGVFNASTTQSEVNEPGTLALFGLGLAGLGFFARKRKAA